MSNLLPVQTHSLGRRGRAVHPINWRAKYGGLTPSEMKRLRQLEEENGKLKKLVADLSLDKAMLQDVIRRKI
jgi:putative transposase